MKHTWRKIELDRNNTSVPRKAWYRLLKYIEGLENPYQLLHISIIAEARIEQLKNRRKDIYSVILRSLSRNKI